LSSPEGCAEAAAAVSRTAVTVRGKRNDLRILWSINGHGVMALVSVRPLKPLSAVFQKAIRV
jgi:hypothetical protein